MKYLRLFNNSQEYEEFINSGAEGVNVLVSSFADNVERAEFSDIANEQTNAPLMEVAERMKWTSDERSNVLTVMDCARITDETLSSYTLNGLHITLGGESYPAEETEGGWYLNGNTDFVVSSNTWYFDVWENMYFKDAGVDETVTFEIVPDWMESAVSAGTYTFRKYDVYNWWNDVTFYDATNIFSQEWIDEYKSYYGDDIKVMIYTYYDEWYSATTIDAYAAFLVNAEDGEYAIHKDYGLFSNIEHFDELKHFTNITALPRGSFSSGKVSYIELPSNIKSLADSCFHYCENIKNIGFNNELENIGNYAFYSSGLEGELKLPNSLKTIGVSAFYRCSGLTKVEMCDNVETIGNGAFNNCQNIESARWSSAVTTIDSNSFTYCSALTDVYNTQSVSAINSYAFYQCTSLSGIDLTNVEILGGGSMKNVALKEVIAPNLREMPEYGAFSSHDQKTVCENLKKVYAPNLTILGQDSFRWCGNLEYLYAPKTEEIQRCAYQHTIVQYHLYPNLNKNAMYCYAGNGNNQPYEFWLLGGEQSGWTNYISYAYSKKMDVVFLTETPKNIFNGMTAAKQKKFTLWVPDNSISAYASHSAFSACTIHGLSEFVSNITYDVDTSANTLTVVMSPVTYNSTTSGMDINDYDVEITSGGNLLEQIHDYHYKLVYNILDSGNVTINISGKYSWSPSTTLNISL